VTHVRNLLAATTIIEDGDSAKVPVRGGPSTGTVSVVEKIEGRWKIRRHDGREIVQLQDAHEPDTTTSPVKETAEPAALVS